MASLGDTLPKRSSERFGSKGDIVITLIDKTGQNLVFYSDSYLLLTIEDGKVKATGDIDLKVLAPILMKLAMEKFSAK